MTHEFSGREGTDPTKPAVQRRLEFIDFRLLWSGRINRKDLADVFRLSSQQASADIAAYEQRARGNLRYDNALKTYVRTETFKPLFVGDYTDRYLLQLVAVRSGYMRKEDTWFEALPPYEIATLKRRPIDTTNVQRVLEAIRNTSEIEIEYSSINTAEKKRRWIAPHALGYGAGRWHVRACSLEHNDFRDFNINRIGGVVAERKTKIDPNLDFEWHHSIDLVIVPNPKLDEETTHAVEEEYNMLDGRLVQNARLSLVFYLMSEHNLDVKVGLLDPKKQQLVLSNREEVETERRIARKMSSDALGRLLSQ